MKKEILKARIKIIYLKNESCSRSGNPQFLIIYKVRGCTYLRHAYTQRDINQAYGLGDWSLNKWFYIAYYWDDKKSEYFITRIDKIKERV